MLSKLLKYMNIDESDNLDKIISKLNLIFIEETKLKEKISNIHDNMIIYVNKLLHIYHLQDILNIDNNFISKEIKGDNYTKYNEITKYYKVFFLYHEKYINFKIVNENNVDEKTKNDNNTSNNKLNNNKLSETNSNDTSKT
jgi:hypothetical protein